MVATEGHNETRKMSVYRQLTVGTEACSTQCDFTILEFLDKPFQNAQETIVGVFHS